MRELLEEMKQEIDGKEYILSKFPASAGRDIVCQFVPSAIPKIGNYKLNREMADRIMSYVAVPMPDGSSLRLTTEALIDNHVKDWESRLRIEAAMMAYNCRAFQEGRVSSFFGDFAQILTQWTSSTLTDSLQQLLAKIKQPSTN